ncbi:MAG: N-6 DNA methylase, partial [Candidatus Paceibacterota bacterium]
FNGFGKFDFVMANPPFNVKSVKESTVKNDPRFYTYGLPKNKGKKTNDSISDANYLWVSLFATSLNKNGRAGFVMPNSASDAGNSEYDIRKKIVDSGIVDCMVSMPSNMFFTVTLPATLWFFDQQKAHTDRKDKILFIDARNTYHQIDRAHREWKEEQIQNLAAIVRLYRGETERYLELINHYILQAADAFGKVYEFYPKLNEILDANLKALKQYTLASKSKLSPAKKEKLEEADFFQKVNSFERIYFSSNEESIIPEHPLHAVPLENNAQKQIAAYFSSVVNSNKNDIDIFKAEVDQLISLWQLVDKNLKIKSDKTWTELGLLRADKMLDEALQECITATDDFAYWYNNMNWLQSRFPEAKYADVVGLCKLADKTEYADEQDYSMNAGRYVGVEIEDDSITRNEFKEKMHNLLREFDHKSIRAEELGKQIVASGKVLLS